MVLGSRDPEEKGFLLAPGLALCFSGVNSSTI